MRITSEKTFNKPPGAEERLPLRAICGLPPVALTSHIMYMPAGLKEISCALGDSAYAHVFVIVDEDTAAVAHASLAALNAKHAPQRALFDKEHEHKEAMAWPEAFTWEGGARPGVYASAEYSSLGNAYVKGKVVRAFSPSFFTDADFPGRASIVAGRMYEAFAGKRGSRQNPARIIGLDFPYSGTFTNNPAFRDILPLWANHAAGAQPATSVRPTWHNFK